LEAFRDSMVTKPRGELPMTRRGPWRGQRTKKALKLPPAAFYAWPPESKDF